MANEALERVWLAVRDEIRRQRGRSRFRGTEIHLLPKREIRLPVENRRGKLQRSEIVIHLHEIESELWAIQEPDGKRFAISDYNHRLDQWIGKLLDVCRGEEYLRTDVDEAKYRDQFVPKKGDGE